jgi:DNA repair protein RecO (recombination protein O)
MPAYCSNAIVLRTYRYGEADRIVVFLTEDRGKKRGVARNASRSRRRFGAALEPLTTGRATYMEREARELVRLDRLEPIDTPLGRPAGRPMDEAVRRLGLTSYFAELLDEWAPHDAPNERLFRLGVAVGSALGRAGGSSDALARYFEFWLLRLEGVYPALDRCTRCAQPLADGAQLSRVERSFVCLACGGEGVFVSRPALDLLRRWPVRTPVQVADEAAPPAALRELDMAHHTLIAIHLEKSLRSSRVVRELGSPS